MKRILIKRWLFDRRYEFCHQSAPPKKFVRYTPSSDLEEAVWMKLKQQELGLIGTDDLARIALYAGLYTRLWVGEMDGIIAPMDKQPEGWTYANGVPIETSWFWQWHPSDRSKEKLLKELETTNPIALDSQPATFKTLVPFQIDHKMGTMQDIAAINVIDLPNYVRSDVPFIGIVQKWPKMGNTRKANQAISRNDPPSIFCFS